ncbi:hypothetical protein [Anthocerotibacter panamensis]|uniref:hypothetical protein n=1 Tax=Anthocerotibacter panamensis TaxID=2857077 RepID=UPI001C40825E|nr:hypothetical protein [Anthocerotibacter panamensis]
MDETTALKDSALGLINQAGDLLGAFLALHEQVFSWKNALGWNKFDRLKPALAPLTEQGNKLVQAAKDQLILAQALDETHADKDFLGEFYGSLVKYLEFLKQALQILGKLIAHLEDRAAKDGSFKKTVYEFELAQYKQKVDMYQLYGQQLNQSLDRLLPR